MSREDLTPADCHAYAAQARRQAAVATSERDRAAWIKIAQEWEEIATALEDLPGAREPEGPGQLH